jgi:hypothetical protein
VSDTKNKLQKNRYYGNLVRIFANETQMTRFHMCRTIQQMYRNEFYKHNRHERQWWTMRSIRAHAEKHGGMDEEARRRDLCTILFQCLQEVQRNMLRMRETSSGRTWISGKGVDMLVKLTGARNRLVQEGARA